MAEKQKLPYQPVVALDPVSFKELKKYEKAQEGDEDAIEDIRRNNYVLNTILKNMGQGGKELQRMAFEVDPDKNYSGFASLYRAKTCLTPDHIIKRITGPQGDDLVCQILQARSNHVSSFGRPRSSRFSVGFDFEDMSGGAVQKDPELYAKSQEEQKAAKETMWNCGYRGLEEDWHPNMSQFLKMVTRDGLAYGRFAVEMIYAPDVKAGEEKLHSFRAVDAGTIYRIMPHNELDQSTRVKALDLLRRIKNKNFEIEKYKEDEYRWVQVVEGRPIQAFTDKELVVYNLYPVTNIEYNGYPLTPIDQSLHAITTHINITIHNKLYFQNGRAARGMLVFKSDTLDEQTIHKIRMQFHQSINSVQNCLHGSSTIWTKEKGQISLEDYLSGLKEKTANIWTGTEWASGLVYKTGEKRLIETHMRNGITLKTSPDHRFRVLSETGEPIWKEQRDLVVGDYVLANRKNPVVEELPTFNGKEVTPELMEVLGWLTGDGSLGNRRTELFYHHEKEQEIRQCHFDILKDFGLNFEIKDKERTQDQIEAIKKKYGFKSVASVITSLVLNSKKSVGYFRELGFNLSCDGKNVPQWIYTLPEIYKYAYLRGLFSADGNNAKLRSPEITISNGETRNAVKLLLLSAGIRTNLSEGKTKVVIKGSEREYIEAESVLRIKDKLEFFNKIGFIQCHKHPCKEVFAKNKNINDKLPRSVIVHYCKEIREFDKVSRNLNRRQRQSITDIICCDTCSRPRLIRYMEDAKYPVPAYLNDYHAEEVVKIIDTKKMVPMFDVSINTEDHMFVSSGFCLHNSWRMPVFGVGTDDDVRWESIDISGRDAEFQYLMDNNARVILSAFQMSPEELPGYQHLARGTNTQALAESNNEYKLTAARDVGLRPLLLDVQDFLNSHILPKFHPELSKTHQMTLVGLDKDSPEKEATRLGQDIGLHMSYDEIMEAVEKDRIGEGLGGKFPLNPQFQEVLFAHFSVGELLENIMGKKGAASDPRFNYYRDPWWFQYQQLLVQKAQMAMQQQMMMLQQQQQMMAPQGGDPGMEGEEGGGGEGEQPPDSTNEGAGNEQPQEEEQVQEEQPQLGKIESIPAGASKELKKSINEKNKKTMADYNQQVMAKAEKQIKNNHNQITKMILNRHKEITKKRMKDWKSDSQKALKAAKAALGDNK